MGATAVPASQRDHLPLTWVTGPPGPVGSPQARLAVQQPALTAILKDLLSTCCVSAHVSGTVNGPGTIPALQGLTAQWTGKEGSE